MDENIALQFMEGFIPLSPIDLDSIIEQLTADNAASDNSLNAGAVATSSESIRQAISNEPNDSGADASAVAVNNYVSGDTIEMKDEPTITPIETTATEVSTIDAPIEDSELKETTDASHTIPSSAVEELPPSNQPSSASIDAFLEETCLKVVKEQNAELRKESEYYKEKCAYLRSEISRALDERNSERNRVSYLRKQYDDLEDKLAEATKKLKEYKHKLEDARVSLDKEKRIGDEAIEDVKKEKRLNAQNEQQIERLQHKIEKLEEMLATEHDRSKEYKAELEKHRSALAAAQPHPHMFPTQHTMSMMHSVPHHVMPPFPSHQMAQSGMESDSHYTSIEHPNKRQAREHSPPADLREMLQPKQQHVIYKRLCYHGNKCKRSLQPCNFAHSIDELEQCPYGKKCYHKARCGFMIHSEADRVELKTLVYSRGKKEILCDEYDKNKICRYGEKCNKIHW